CSSDLGGSNPASQIQTLLTTSHASNFASGQFRSSEIDGAHALGWVDDGSSKVTVAYTYYGDANVNGTVDLTDFTFLAANFNKPSGAVWQQGDFNYDTKVDR